MILSDPNISAVLKKLSDDIQELKALTLKQNKPFLNILEASEYLKLSRYTLYRYCSLNLIPFYKLKSTTYFKIEELDAWVLDKNHKHKSNSEIESEAQTRVLSHKNTPNKNY
jgi:excisionase family DNA binding protein